MKNKIKLLMLLNYIPHYRVPIYNKLGELYDLTIAHYGEFQPLINTEIKQIILSKVEFFKFKFYKENIYKLANQYDVVISLAELWALPNVLLSLSKRKFSLIYWGIGVGGSYRKKFGEKGFVDKFRYFLSKRSDATIFYSDFPIHRYIDNGIRKEKLFVANNTVEVKERIEILKEKRHFLFVGTLYIQKKVYDLLHAYLEYFQLDSNPSPLLLIGNGEEFHNISEWIIRNNLKSQVILLGQINDQEILKEYYKNAIACISPGQAGLTVLNSMAYGVPFVTEENAITGGEILNINSSNGVLYSYSDNLSDILYRLKNQENFAYDLSVNAQNYYFENRTIDNMIIGFVKAIEFSMFNKKK